MKLTRGLILALMLCMLISVEAYPQRAGADFNQTVTVTELQLNSNGDVINRVNVPLQLYRNSRPGTPYSYVLFLEGKKESLLCEFNKSRDARVCMYDLPRLGSLKTGLMLSSTTPRAGRNDLVDIIRVSHKDSSGYHYLSYERYDISSGRSITHDIVWQLDEGAFNTFLKFFRILIDSFDASYQNTISRGVQLK